MKKIEIKTEKEYSISATIYPAETKGNLLIIASATGVKQEFYKKFAEFIQFQGISVITFDYFGIGSSLKQPIKNLQNNASDWGKYDLETVIKFTKNNYPDTKITLLGHSIGGQLIGLAKSSQDVHKIILVATQSGYWKLWKGFEKIKMWFNWYVLFPSLIAIFDYMPSKKFSGMENLPKNVAKQWSSWGRKPNYLFDDIPEEDLFFKKITSKIVSISIDDDSYAPKEAVDWFINQYKNAEIKKNHLSPIQYNTKHIGHFGVFREKFSNNLWKLLLNYILE